MRSGLVLLELLVVMVLIGLLAAVALPDLASAMDRAAVREETLRVVAALDAARGAAVRLGGEVALTLADSAYQVTAVSGSDTTVPWRRPGPLTRGTTLGGGGAPLHFGPAGLAMGASNRTIVVARGSAVRRIVISRLGRITY
ncbi:MAG: GspH/FimT family pseudopilin [Gemmatimonadales bacterium]